MDSQPANEQEIQILRASISFWLTLRRRRRRKGKQQSEK